MSPLLSRYYGLRAAADGTVLYSDVRNLMEPGTEYLIFMEASPLNRGTAQKQFWIEENVFGYLPVTAADSPVFSDDRAGQTLEQLSEYSFFCVSEPLTRAINTMQKTILQTYLGTAG